MDFKISNKVAFVAASSQGLGKATAIELAHEGVKLAICGRNSDTLNAAKEEIESLSEVEVLPLMGDLSKEEDRDSMISKTIDHFGGIDILVTNTGGPPSGKFEDTPPEQWDKAYQQLLVSATSLIRGFLPGMKENKWGRIITITSQAVKQPVQNLVLSNAMRASVVGLMKTLSQELGEYNITVNNVMPGYTQTTRLDKLIEANASFANAVNEIPLARFGDPKEFAAMVAFLASDRASYITGISVAVDGGWIKNIL